MSAHMPDVPIIGRTQQVMVVHIEVVVPNMIEVVSNGLDAGNSVAHLRITNPVQQKAYWVPITEEQCAILAEQLTVMSAQHIERQSQQRGNHGIH